MTGVQTCALPIYKKLKRIEGDIYTIGGTFALDDKNNFTNHKFKYKDNTTIYMFSDGYSDQFGGIKNKKFLVSQFEEMLLDNNELSMKDQAEILDITFNSWRGNSKQIDDILVIGINFSNT